MFLLLLLLPLALAKCPLKAQWSTEYNTCYLFVEANAYWSAAEGICQNLGGHVASVKDQKQNDYLWSLIQNWQGTVWIGSHVVNGAWINSDGTNFTYSNFPGGTLHAPFKNTVAGMVAYTDQGLPSNGSWQYADDNIKTTNFFLCSFPPCQSDGTLAPSLLNSTNPMPGLIYGGLTNAWYYGTPANQAQLERSEDICASIAGNLPTIENAYQNSQLQQIATKLNDLEYIALGLTSSGKGVWSWMDGSNSTYWNWAQHEPSSNSSMNTLLSVQTGLWNAIDEFNHVHFICEFSQTNRKYC